MKIAIDIDNTICDTSIFFKDLTIKYDRKFLNKNNNIDFTKAVPRSNEWSKEELKYYIENIFNKESINIPIKKDASLYINKLKELGYEITFITNRGIKEDDHTDLVVQSYLDKYNIPYDRVITKTNDKYKFLSDFDYFIDDSINECELVLANTNCKVIMMKSTLNDNYSNSSLFKTDNWEEIYNYIIKDNEVN